MFINTATGRDGEIIATLRAIGGVMMFHLYIVEAGLGDLLLQARPAA